MKGGELPLFNLVTFAIAKADETKMCIRDRFKGGDGKGDMKVINVMTHEALDAAKWCRDYLGVRFDEGTARNHRRLHPRSRRAHIGAHHRHHLPQSRAPHRHGGRF